jgi:hypothetical protein
MGRVPAWATAKPLVKEAITTISYRGFVEEGRRTRQYRRASGELWDSIVMARAL